MTQSLNNAVGTIKKTHTTMDINMEQIQKNGKCYLLFSVNGILYGIETSFILGIVQSDTVTSIPHTSCAILGIMKLRGTLCTVVDFCQQLHGQPNILKWPLLLISLMYREHRVCAVVDEVLSVVEIDDMKILTSDPSQTQMQSKRYVTAYADIGGKIVHLLSMEQIIAAILAP